MGSLAGRVFQDAEFAVDALRVEGFRNTDISVLFAENEGTKDLATEKHTKAPEGSATGAATGGVIGGVLGWLVGLGTLAIPGVGPLIAAGPIVAALTGVGVGGTIGGIAGALIGMGIPEYEAKRYEGRIKEGGILLSGVLRCRALRNDSHGELGLVRIEVDGGASDRLDGSGCGGLRDGGGGA